MDETIRIEDRWYVLATSSHADDRIRVLKHGETFAVFDRFGDIHRIGTGGQGLYHQGTRFLSQFELRVNDYRPMLISSNARQDNSLLTVDLTNPDLYEAGQLAVRKGNVHVFRAKLLWQTESHEHLRLTNYGELPISLKLTLLFGADYADIFEVRGFERARRGQDLPAALHDDGVVLAYTGLDGLTRRTVLRFSPAPTELAEGRADYRIALPPKGKVDLHLSASCESGPGRPAQPTAVRHARPAGHDAPATRHDEGVDYLAAYTRVETALEEAQGRCCSISTPNEQFNDWIRRSAADLAMLTADTPEGPYPYAGVPWYSTPFGRDGILTAIQYLFVDPAMARGVLGFLARLQASAKIPEQDAEPGKILHEMRHGELAALGEIPFGCYYGSIDSTPLFIVLAGAYLQRTGDLTFVRSLWPNIERALEWIDRHGDVDGDGFVEYQRHSSDGLTNQAWKDSEDAVFHRDGELADAPLALAEVQGYVYLARLHAADIAELLGRTERAQTLRCEATQLRERFEQAFWSEELGTYAIALDGAKRPCLIRSSNAGQVLWSGIASFDRAVRTGETLLSPASFSGWGVRTIAEGEARHNPMSYHNGSIWPHDNALIAMGLARYGMKDKALAILEALFDASVFMDLNRLPELYCGFVRRAGEGPTLYPVACSPQAWAAASVFYLLQACLGMSFDSAARCISFDHPILPPSLTRIEIFNLRFADAVVDLSFERHVHDVAVNVLRKEGEVEVSVLL